MIFKDFFAGDNDNERRLDKVLRIFISETNLSSIYKSIRKGLIKVNDKKTSPDYHIKKGDKISIAEFLFDNNNNSTKNDIQSSKISQSSQTASQISYQKIKTQQNHIPQIAFQNEHIIIFNKPRNMTVQGNSSDSLDKIVSAYYETQVHNNTSLSFKTGPLHRIDRFTTGLIAFSWSIDGARWFSESIKNHTIQKKYIGIIQGKLLEQEEWHDFIKKDDNERDNSEFHTVKVLNTASRNDIEKKEAFTTVTPLAYGKIDNTEITVAEFFIKTGRHHQIRAQASNHNHPLYGDTAYGGKKNKENTFYLHAAKLIIPINNPLKLPLEITAPLPDDFLQIITKSCDICNFKL